MADIERLKKSRAVIRQAVTKFTKEIETNLNADEINFDNLEETIETLKHKETELKTLDTEIGKVEDVTKLDKEIETALSYVDKIILWTFRANKALNKRERELKSSEKSYESIPESNNTIPVPKISLPKLSITKYNGSIYDWQNFWSTFKAAIHENDSLNKIDKFNYLKSYLTDRALNTIEGFELSEENYDSAIELLKERFGRRELIINAHMNKLLNLTPVTRANDVYQLRKLYDNIEIHIRSLKSLGVESETYGNLLCPILMKVIPSDMALDFSRKSSQNSFFDVKELLQFICSEVESRERAKFLNNYVPNTKKFDLEQERKPFQKWKGSLDSSSKKQSYSINYPTGAVLTAAVKNNCIFCNNNEHETQNCRNTSVDQRRQKLMKEARCFLCFRRYHRNADCRAKIGPCELCNGKTHNKLVCNVKIKPEDIPQPQNQTVVSSVSQCSSENSDSKKDVLLQTCSAKINSKFNCRSKYGRILLDNASMRSFCTQQLARKLKLEIIRKEKLLVYVFGSRNPAERIYDVARVKLENINNPDQNIIVELLVTETISGAFLCSPSQNIQELMRNKNLQLADSYENAKSSVDILIGADFFWEVINHGRVEKLNKTLFAIETLFGWTVQGRVSCELEKAVNESLVNICVMKAELKSLHNFWDLESIGILDNNEVYSDLDKRAINLFEENINYKEDTGRYQTKLLWKLNKEELDNNFEVAKKRFFNLADRLKKDNSVLESYKETIDDQINQGIVENCNASETKETYYMPHRAIIKPDKSTKVRIVFDASSKGKLSNSLNDCLISGPNLNPNILDVILKFREHKIAFCADIEKAFLQIEIANEDRNVLRFLWFSDNANDNSWKTLRMTRVPFGVTTSPFLLSATIKYHIKKYEDEKPECVKMLNNSLYVDDLFYGANNIDTAYDLSSDAVEILRDAGMKLRKFQTNSKELRSLWEDNNISNEELEEINDSPLKVLGIIWNTKEDIFRLEVQPLLDSLNNLKNTKRCVLQTAAKIFDPAGFISPFVIRIKCLFQEIWEKGLDWDDELPQELKIKWDSWCSEITDLKKLSINRQFFPPTFIPVKTELHIFCDASPRAYGACAYFRYQNEDKETIANLIMSKSRVSPLKRLTLPRLELMGTVIGARLAKYLTGVFQITAERVFLWTDSTIALHWIKGAARNWKPFVSNRVTEIQSMTDPLNWQHCKGIDNPADFLTRGEKVTSVLTAIMWWHGPDWLTKPKELWPRNCQQELNHEISIERAHSAEDIVQFSCSAIRATEAIMDIEKFSRLSRVYRVTAWIQRFINNTRNSEKKTGTLSAEELLAAEIYWVQHIQSKHFNEEMISLEKNKPIDKSSRLHDFNPVLDSNGLLCLGGRLQNSDLEPQQKHPWIIPGKTRFTELLILHNHLNVYHSGVTDTLIQTRERYWIIKGRQVIKTVLNKCLICRRFKARPGNMIVAPLPKDRIQESCPFEKTGVDFAGPLYAKGKENQKCYILLCTCAVTRAIHLELVTDLTTKTFLLALRRFFSRRGVSTVIYSDNAKTFKRANLELKELWSTINDPEVKDYYGSKGITWKYIVERGAWWGGFWERMVKSVKTCLRKVLGKTSLSIDELNTTLTEIESTINSRPITYVYSDSNEPSPLTPAHFLIGKRLTSLPPVSKLKERGVPAPAKQKELLKRYLYRQRLLDNYWKRWKHEYLLLLKGAITAEPVKNSKEFKQNDIVLISEEKVPRNFWKLGRIIEVHKERDTKVRSCTVKTFSGTLKRPIQLLHNLEL